jgi:RNA polymerase sigma-70 factor (ECF subfamily)
MSGKDNQEEAVLAAAKTLKAVEFSGDSKESTANSNDYAVLKPHAPSARPANAERVETLFEQYHDRVFRTAYRVTGSAADAEDVLQTIFVRMARGQEGVDAADNTEAYLSRAAINASLDLLRSRKRSKAVAMDDVEDRASVAEFVSQQNPETHHEDRELRNLIREAVAKLGATAGQMFALRYFEGYGNAEIAGIMNTSPLVVGVTLHRARARLRKEIGRYMRQGAGG